MAIKIRRGALVTLASALWLLASSTAFAHHSTAAYDSSKTLTLSGVVSEVKWVNPHSYVNIMVTGADGQQTKWSILSGTPTLNVRNGWKYGDVKVGDKVTVVVHPSRDPKLHAAIMRRITLADGRTIAGPREFLTVPAQTPAHP